MEYIGDTGAETSDDLCPHEDVDGQKRCKVVAYHIDDDATRLDLYTALWQDFGPMDEVPILGKDQVSRWTGWAYRFVGHALKKDFKRFEANPEALAVAKEIRAKVSTIRAVRVHFITNALVRSKTVDPVTDSPREVTFEVWDLERLQRAGDDVKTRDLIEVDFEKLMGEPLQVLETKRPTDEYQTFLAVIPGQVLSELYKFYSARLFEFNVRSFLQAKGKVNKGIRRTLLDEPERFLAYNNGLTATADEVEVGTENGITVIRRLRGLQIVNGAQTTASLHRAAWEDKVDLSGVAVAMKLTCVKPDKLASFVPRISEPV
jgi:hypothetical protein